MPGEREEARIKERAYAIWEEEGHPHGKHEEHWQRAIQRTRCLGALGGEVPALALDPPLCAGGGAKIIYQ
jgi:hypothetical protein